MSRPSLSALFVVVLLSVFSGVGWGQNRMPASADNYLFSAYRGASDWYGDYDKVQVVFFEVDDSVSTTTPLYFGVYDPGTDASDDSLVTTLNPGDMSYRVYGGTGAYTDATSRQLTYTAPTAARAGSLLAQLSIPGASASASQYNDSWTWLPAVYPSQGEHVGNKYLFKFVAVGAKDPDGTAYTDASDDFLNRYQVAVSTSNSGAPAVLSTVRAFAYSLQVVLEGTVAGGSQWNLYPFVPTGTSLASYIRPESFDGDYRNQPNSTTSGFSWTLDRWDGTTYSTAGAIFISDGESNLPGVGTLGSAAASQPTAANGYLVNSTGATGRTWRFNMLGGGESGGTEPNGVDVWAASDSSNANLVTNTINTGGGTALRLYAAEYTAPTSHHAVLTPSTQNLQQGAGTAALSVQLVDSVGNMAPESKKVRVRASGSAVLTGSSITETRAANDVTVTTAADGSAAISLSDGVVETVTVTFNTDGVDSDATSGADSDNLGASAPYNTAYTAGTVSVVANPLPTLSSATNSTSTAGTALTLPTLTLAANGGTLVTAASDLRIHIPSGLTAVWDTSVTTATLGGSASGSVSATVSYSDSKTLVLNVTTSWTVGTETLTVAGLKFTSATGASSGNLELAYNGASPTYDVVDDKVITFNPQVYVWVGGTGGNTTTWSTATNWSGGAAPSLATDNVKIPSGLTYYPIVTAGALTMNNLEVQAGASLQLNGATALTIGGTWTNDGALILNGNETVTGALPTTSGTVRFAGTASYSSFSGLTSFYHLSFTGTGTYTAPAAATITVNGNLTIASVSGTLNAGAATTWNVAGNWALTSGTFTASTSTVALVGSSSTTISGTNTFSALSITTPGKTVYLTTGLTQTVGTLTVTGAAGNPVRLRSTAASIATLSRTTATVSYVDLYWVTVNASTAATNSSGTGTTTNWVITNLKTWNGTGTDWATAANWTPTGVPAGGESVYIPVTANVPVLSAATNSLLDLTIAAGATLNLATYQLNVTGAFNNNGTLKLDGTLTQGFTNDTNSGTVDFTGGSAFGGFTSFYNLTVSGGSHTAVANLTVHGNFVQLASTTVAIGTNTLSVSGNLSNAGTISGSNPILFTNTTLTGGLSSGGASLLFTNPITLTGAATITTGGGALTFQGTINGNYAFVTNSGTGVQTFQAAVGNLSRPTSITLNGSGQLRVLANQSAAGNTINYNAPFYTNVDVTVSETTGNVNFNDTVTIDGDVSGTTLIVEAPEIDFTAGPNTVSGTGTNPRLELRVYGSTDDIALGGSETAGRLDLTATDLAAIGSTLTSVTIDTTSGTTSWEGSATLNSPTTLASGLVINAGTLTLGANLSVNGGLVNNAGTFVPGTFTVTFSGTGTWSASPLYDAVFANGAAVTMGASATVSRDVQINTGGSLAASTFTLTVGRNWTNTPGASGFTGSASTVIFDVSQTAHAISGSTTFGSLTVDASAAAAAVTVTFASGSVQTLAAAGTLTLRGKVGQLLFLTGGGDWTIDPSSASQTVSFIQLENGNAQGTDITASNSSDYLNNNQSGTNAWLFPASSLTWTGSASTAWSNAANWDLGFVPNSGDDVIIPDTSLGSNRYPVLTAAIAGSALHGLTLSSSVSQLDLNGQNLTVGAGGYASSGSLLLEGLETVAGLGSPVPGTVVFNGAGAGTFDGLTSFTRLSITGAGSFTPAAPTTVSGAFSSTAGTVVVGGGVTLTLNGVSFAGGTVSGTGTVNVAGDVARSSGGFNLTGGTLTFNGSAAAQTAALAGSTVNHLAVSNTSGTPTVTLSSYPTWSGNAVLTAGTLVLGSNTALAVGGNVSGAGALDASALTGTLSIGGDLNVTTLTAPGGTFEFNGAGAQTITPNGQTLPAVLISNTAGTVSLNASLPVASLTVNASAVFALDASSAPVTLSFTSASGNITNNGTVRVASAAFTVTLDGTSTTTTVAGSPLTLNGLPMTWKNVTAVSHTLAAGENLTLIGATVVNNLTTAGSITFDPAAASSLTVASLSSSGGVTNAAGFASTITASGSVSLSSGTFANPTRNTLTLTGAGTSLAAAATLGHVTVNSAGTVSAGSNLVLDGNLLVTGGILDPLGRSVTLNNAAQVRGSIVNSGAAAAFTASGALTLAANTSITTNGGNASFTSVTGASSGGQTFAVNAGAGTVSFSSTIGATALASLSLTSLAAAPALTLGGDVTTVGGQTYAGAVTLGASAVLTTTNAAITTSSTFDATTAGTQTLTVALGSGTWTASGDVGANQALGTLTRTSGTLAWGNLTLAGGLIYTAGPLTSTGTVTLNGGAAQSINFTNATLTNVVLNNAAGATLTNTAAFTWLGDLTLTAGALTFADFAQTIGGAVSGAGGLNAGAMTTNLTVAGSVAAGNWTPGSGSLLVGGTAFNAALVTSPQGTLVFNGSSALAFTTNAQTFAGLSLSTAAKTVTVTGDLTLNGALAVATGNVLALGTGTNNLAVGGAATGAGSITAGAGTLTFAGAYSLSGALTASSVTTTFQGATVLGSAFTANGGTVLFTGAATPQTFDANGRTLGAVTVNKGAKAQILRLTGNLTLADADLALTQGTLDANGFAITLNDANAPYTNGNFSAGANGALDLSTSATSSLTLAGAAAWNAASTFLPGAAAGNTVTFQADGGTTTRAVTSAGQSWGNIVVNRSVGTLQLADAVSQTAGRTLTLTSGTLDLNGQTFTPGASLTLGGGSSPTLAVNGGVWAGGSYNLTQNAASTLSLGTGGTLNVTNWTQSAGTFDDGTGAAINASGAVAVTGGTHNADSSTLTMTGASTTVRFNASSPFNLVVNGTVSVATNDLTVAGALTVAGGTFSVPSNALTVTGTTSVTGTLSGGSGLLTLTGAANGAGTFSVGSGGLTFASTYGATTSNGTFTMTGNSASALTFTGNAVLSGTITGNATAGQDPSIVFLADATLTGATLTANGDVTAFQGGANQAFTTGGVTLGPLLINKSANTVTTSGDVSATNLTVTANTLSVALADTLTVTTAAVVNGGTLSLDGSYAGSAATFALSSGSVIVNTKGFDAGAFTQTGGALTQTGDNTVNPQRVASLALSTGTMNWDNGSVGGSFVVTGALAQTSGTLNFHQKNVTLGTSVSGSIVLYDLVIPNGKTLVPLASSSITVNRHLDIQAGGAYSAVNNPTLILGGVGGVAGNLSDSNGTLSNLGAVTVSTATKTQLTPLSMTSLAVTSTLTTNDQNLTVSGSLSGSGTLAASAGGAAETILVGGDFIVAGFTPANSTVELNTSTASSFGVALGYTVNNLTVNKGAAGTTVTAAGDVTVDGVLTWTRGTWAAGANLLTLTTGDWNSSSANVVFSAGSGTVVLAAAAPTVTVKTSDTLYNLTLNQGATLASDLKVGNNFTAANSGTGGTLTLGTAVLAVGNAVNLHPSGTGATLSAGSSTLSLTGTGAQNVTSNAQTWSAVSIVTRGGSAAVTFVDAFSAASLAAPAGLYSVNLSNGGTITSAVTFANTAGVTIGAGYTFTGGVTATAAGTNTWAGTVATGGGAAQNLNVSNLTLGGNLTLNTGSLGTIGATGAVTGGANTLTIVNSGGATFGSTLAAATLALSDTAAGQTIALNGNVTLTTGLTVAGTANAYNVTLAGTTNTIAGNTVFGNTGTLTIATTTTGFTGGATATAPSSKNLAGTVTASGTGALDFGTTAIAVTANATLGGTSTGAITVGATTIAAGATFTIGAGSASTVTASTINGAAASSNLTINVTGTATVTGAVGPTLGTVTVQNSGGTVFQSVAAATATLTATTGTVDFQGLVTLTNLTTASSGYAVRLRTGGSVTTAATFSNTGGLTIDAGFTFTGGATATTAGTNNWTGTVATGGGATQNLSVSNLTLGGNLTLNSGSLGTIGATGAVTGGANTLTIANSGGATFASTLDAATLAISATTGTVAVQGSLTVTDLTTTASVGAVTLANTTSVTNAAVFLNTGLLTLGASSGGPVLTFAGGITTSGSATNPSSTATGGSVLTNGNTALFGPVSLLAATVLATTNTVPAGANLTVAGAVSGAFNLTTQSGTAGITSFQATVGTSGARVGLSAGTTSLTIADGLKAVFSHDVYLTGAWLAAIPVEFAKVGSTQVFNAAANATFQASTTDTTSQLVQFTAPNLRWNTASSNLQIGAGGATLSGSADFSTGTLTGYLSGTPTITFTNTAASSVVFGTVTINANPVLFSGSASTAWTTNGQTLDSVTVNKSAGTVTLASQTLTSNAVSLQSALTATGTGAAPTVWTVATGGVTVTAASTVSWSDARFVVQAGDIAVAGALNLATTGADAAATPRGLAFTGTGQTLSNTGTLTFVSTNAASPLHIIGGTTTTWPTGDPTWTAGDVVLGSITHSGTLTQPAAAKLYLFDSNVVLTNAVLAGTLQFDGYPTTTAHDLTFTGSFDFSASTAVLANPALVTFLNITAVNLRTNGVAPGSILKDVTFAGTGASDKVTLVGDLALSGNLIQASTAAWDLGGATVLVQGNVTLNPATAADFVSANSTFSLNGTTAQALTATQPFYNLFVNAPGATITPAAAVSVSNRFAAFRGTWAANGQDLTVGEDFVVYGPGFKDYTINGTTYYAADDGEVASRGPTDYANKLGYPYWTTATPGPGQSGSAAGSYISLFAYNALTTTAFTSGVSQVWGANVSAVTYLNVLSNTGVAGTNATASFTFNGGEILSVAKNFYNFGASMTSGVDWTLTLAAKYTSVKLNAAKTTDWFGYPFAVALATTSGTTISHSVASQPVAAAQTTVGGTYTAGTSGVSPIWQSALTLTNNNAKWDGTQPDFDTTTANSTLTRFDNLVEIGFSKPLKNAGDGILAAATGATASADVLRFNAGAAAFGGFVLFSAGTAGTAGEYSTAAFPADDLQTRVAFKAAGTASWNTNATGLTAGLNSTNRSGVQQSTVVNLSLEKGRLYDASGNPIVNHDGTNFNAAESTTVVSARFTATTDGARPVLSKVELGQAAKAFPPTTSEDGHNYWRLTWSEPVDFFDLTGVSEAVTGVNAGGQIGSTPSSLSTGNLTAVATFGDSYTDDAGLAGKVQLTGLAQYTGQIYRGSRAQNISTGPLTQPPVPTLNSLARSAAGNDLYVYFVGASTGSGAATSWDGFWWGPATSPVGQNYKVALDYVNQVKDKSSNPVEDELVSWNAASGGSDPKVTASVANDTSVPALQIGWELDAPTFADYNEGGATGQFEVLPIDSGGYDKIDEVQFHILSNVGKTGQIWASVGGHPDNLVTSHFGVRDTSLTKFYQGFSLQLASGGPISNFNGSTTGVSNTTTAVANDLFNPVAPHSVNTVDDGYFTQSLVIGSVPASWKPTVNYLAYYDRFKGMVTNLAGRLIDSVSGINTVDRTPPFIALTLTGKDMNTIYVQFSRTVKAVSPTSDPFFKDVLQLSGTVANSITSMTFLDGPTVNPWSNFQQALLHLASPLDPSEVTSIRLNAVAAGGGSSIANGQNQMDTSITYPGTFLALNLVEPVWASDGQGGEGNVTGTAHVIHDFTGNEPLAARDIELQAKVWGGTAMASLPLKLYYDLNVPSSKVTNGIWLPDGLFSFISGVVPQSDNGETRYVDPRSSSGTGGSLKNFLIPGTDAELKTGSDLQFLFRLGSIFAVRAPNPADPRTLSLWKVPLKGVKTQKNGVTILHNVIDPTQGEKTQVLYTMEKAGVIVAQVFALDGSLVRVLARGRQAAGDYSVFWDGRNEGGSVVARGVYFVRVVAPGLDEIRNILVIK